MDLLIYLLKSAGLLTLFFLAYEFLLKKETFFKMNRYFLLTGIFLSSLLPVLVFEKIVWVAKSPNNLDLSNLNFSTHGLSAGFWESLTFVEILTFCWIVITAVFAIRFLTQLCSLFLLLKKTHVHHQENGINYYYTATETGPFSFFKSIVLNPSDYPKEELSLILKHEQNHAQDWHSTDLVLANLVTVFLWFNPLSWLYLKRIRENLEFIADQKTTKDLASITIYQKSLVKTSIKNNSTLPVTNFHHSFIKKRIVMLHKPKSNRNRFSKVVIILPLLAFFMWSFNVETVEKQLPTEKINVNQLQQKIPLYYIDGKKAGKEEADALDPKYIKSIHVLKGKKAIEKYGKDAKNGVVVITTRKAVKTLVTKNGGIRDIGMPVSKSEKLYILNGTPTSKKKVNAIDPNFIKNIEILKDASATAIYGTRGANGVVIITTKKTGKTAAEDTLKKDKKIGNSQKTTDGNHSKTQEKALYFLDGKEISLEKMKAIKKETIQSVYVLKGKSAVKKYGEKAKGGAVEINLKTAAKKTEN